MTESLTTALERSTVPKEARTIQDLIAAQKPAIRQIVGSAEMAERIARVALTEWRRNPALGECDPYSFLGALMQSAQLGLEVGPLGLFYLVPFNKQVVGIVGYKGFCDLAYRSGMVKDIRARLVYEGEPFKEYGGSSPRLVHEIQPQDDSAVGIVAAYALARLKTGGTVWSVIGPREWERARKASPLGSKGRGLWHDHFPEAVRKTAIRRLASGGELPLSPPMVQAMAQDDMPVEGADVQEALAEAAQVAVPEGAAE